MDFQGNQSQEGQEDQGEVKDIEGSPLAVFRSPGPPGLPSGSGLPGNPSSCPNPSSYPYLAACREGSPEIDSNGIGGAAAGPGRTGPGRAGPGTTPHKFPIVWPDPWGSIVPDTPAHSFARTHATQPKSISPLQHPPTSNAGDWFGLAAYQCSGVWNRPVVDTATWDS